MTSYTYYPRRACICYIITSPSTSNIILRTFKCTFKLFLISSNSNIKHQLILNSQKISYLLLCLFNSNKVTISITYFYKNEKPKQRRKKKERKRSKNTAGGQEEGQRI